MSLHLLQLRCQDCDELYFVGKPNRTILIVRIVRLSKHIDCHPEHVADICGGCRLPWGVVEHHSNGLCNKCVVREFRYNAINRITIHSCPKTTPEPQTA